MRVRVESREPSEEQRYIGRDTERTAPGKPWFSKIGFPAVGRMKAKRSFGGPCVGLDLLGWPPAIFVAPVP